MKAIHFKIIAALLVVILVMAIVLWSRGFRQPTPNPDAKSFADSIRESKQRANQNAGKAQHHQSDYEANYQKYNNWRADSSGRDSLGARIWRDAQAADSLRSRTP